MATSHNASPRLSFAGLLLAAIALFVLVLAWGEMLDPLAHSGFGLRLNDGAGGPAVSYVRPGSSAERLGIKRGDSVDVGSMTLSQRMRLTVGSPPGTRLDVRAGRNGRWRTVTLVASPFTAQDVSTNWALVIQATITLLIVAFIALRRPSVATAALVLYGCGAVTTFATTAEFAWIPDPWFGAVAVFIIAAFSELPLFALLPFITRFPHEPTTPKALARRRIADAFFVAVAMAEVFVTIFEPVTFYSWETFHNIVTWVAGAAMLVLALLAYRDESGESRRRIGWVIAGFSVSVLAYAAFDNVVLEVAQSSTPTLLAIGFVVQMLEVALPVALAYAILRHRVMDIGFALNRSVVYAVLTTVVVCIVSLIDWLGSRLLSEQRLALAVEAVATIAVGVSLNRLHARIERFVDSTVFRQRHVAERRIDHRLEALGYATSESTIDEALAGDAADILGLASAAVFRRAGPAGHFERVAAVGWSGAVTSSIDAESLLVRTLRAVERRVVLADLAISCAGLPAGAKAPILAIPIIAQHELIGFALYGNERDGASPDPTEVGLLGRLVSAASSAYGVVEARRWRRRASELEGSLRFAAES